jgi:SAM-dependent methyltransferase
MSIDDEFAGLDIYLFDQLQRGRIGPRDRILDAGCGFGRNLIYFLKHGYDVWAVDADPEAIAHVRDLAARHTPPHAPPLESDPGRFQVGNLEALPFADGQFTVVIASAVLHFARDESRFLAMLDGAWRVVSPGGLFFARLASSIGFETRVRPLGGRRFVLPDGTERFLVDEPCLLSHTARLGGQLLDPIKTTIVQDQRAMTTWVVRRR